MSRTPILSALLALTMGASTAAHAQSAADFKTLEAQVQALQKRVDQLQKEQANSTVSYAPGAGEEKNVIEQSKILLSNDVTQLKLFGDIRLREQYDQNHPVVDFPNQVTDERNRLRFRLRIGADVQLGDQFFAGVTLATGQAADTNNQTFTEGDDNYSIYIDKAFLGWQPTDWFTAIGGKQANPFYTTDLVWDPDITPQGIAETLDLTKAFLPDQSRISMQIVALQGPFEQNGSFTLGSDNAWQFVEQLKTTVHVTKDISFTIAPGYLTYTAASLTGLMNTGAFSKTTDTVTTAAGTEIPIAETRDLSIITAPGDISFKLGGINTKICWDFGYNTEGQNRATDEYFLATHSSRDDVAWLVGFQFGSNNKAGDISLFANYRQVGMDSIDPNLNDSDFALSYLNVQGLKLGVAYNLTNDLVGAVTYYHAWRLNNDITGGEATSGAQLANGKNVDVLQVDLNLKF